MKHSTLFGLLSSLMVSACTGAVHAPQASSDVAVRCTGPITIQRQSDVRAVATTCRSIEGDLRVIGTNVTSLDGLENIRSVDYLVIAQNPKLESIRGLRGLVSARGITIMDNPSLGSLQGLEGVKVREATVIANTGVRSLHGLADLHVREFVVAGNAEPTSPTDG